jgi:phage tail-like protein
VITLLDGTGRANRAWFFRRGLPTKYTGPALNATQNNVAIESIEIAHEGLYQVPGIGPVVAGIGALAGLVG